MRREIRACPASERCFARESSTRAYSCLNVNVATRTASAYQSTEMFVGSVMDRAGQPIRTKLQACDLSNCASSPGRRTSLSADQSHPTSRVDAIHGLVQPDRAAADTRPLDRALAALR